MRRALCEEVIFQRGSEGGKGEEEPAHHLQNKGEEEAKCITQDPVRWQKPISYFHKENLK